MIIKGIPDKWKLGGGNELNVLSKNWINSIASDLNKCLSTNDNRVTIDLSNINFVSAFEWAIFIAIIGILHKSVYTFSLAFWCQVSGVVCQGIAAET